MGCVVPTVCGELHQGREAIARGHQGIFDSIYAGSRVEYTVVDTRTLRDGPTVTSLSATLKVPAGPLAGDNTALATLVIVLGEEGPEIATFHHTLTG